MTIKTPPDRLSRDGTALITSAYYWKRITPDAPWGAKCLLINEFAGSWFEGQLSRNDKFSTHYAAAPTFEPGDKRHSVVEHSNNYPLLPPVVSS